MTDRTRKRLRTATALAVALALVVAAPAAADSISYLRDGNIWLTTPDGSRQFQVTTSGVYSYASQADDGTFVALMGERLHRLSRDGKVLADFDTPVSDGPKKGPNENYFMGPYEPEISPDGKLVSYGYAWYHERFDYTCNCIRYGTDSGTAITYPDRQTSWEEFGGPLTGWMFASWMTNDTLLRSYAGRAFAEEAVVNRVGPGKGDDDMIGWLDSTFDMDEVYQLRDGEITSRGDKAAFVSYDVAHHGESYRSGFNRIRVYRMTGPPPARPEACFYLDGPDQPDMMSSPSFSPDGSKLVWQYGGGISIADIPDLSGGCQSPARFDELLPVGAQPDWGPADVPPAAGPDCCAPHLPKGGSQDPPAGALKLMLTLPKRIKLAVALRKGIAVTVKTGAAGTASATAKSGRSKLGSGAARVGASGKAKVRIRFSRKAARSLRKRTSVRLAIAARFKPAAGGASLKRSASLTLKR
jgi:WD40-like Beta Propeller Repeat